MQRFTGLCEFELLGEYMLYEDHLREMAVLRAEVERFREGMPATEILQEFDRSLRFRIVTSERHLEQVFHWLRRIATAQEPKEGEEGRKITVTKEEIAAVLDPLLKNPPY